MTQTPKIVWACFDTVGRGNSSSRKTIRLNGPSLGPIKLINPLDDGWKGDAIRHHHPMPGPINCHAAMQLTMETA